MNHKAPEQFDSKFPNSSPPISDAIDEQTFNLMAFIYIAEPISCFPMIWILYKGGMEYIFPCISFLLVIIIGFYYIYRHAQKMRFLMHKLREKEAV